MPKRKRGVRSSPSHRQGGDDAGGGAIDQSLRSVLSLSMPRCSACGTGWYDKSGRSAELLPMPPCSCRTTLAVPSDFALPELPERTHKKTLVGIGCGGSGSGGGGTDGGSAAAALLNAIRCPDRFSSVSRTASTWPQTATCRPCLKVWTKSANDVQVYDYRDPKQIRPGFTVEVKCPVCKVRYRKRTVEGLLEGKIGGGGAVAGWEEAVECTVRAVRWAKRVRRRAREVLLLPPPSSMDDANQTSSDGGGEEEEAEARAALQSLVAVGDGPACGHSSDECFSDSDDDGGGSDVQDEGGPPRGTPRGGAAAAAAAASSAGTSSAYARHQMAAPGEIISEFMRRDPKLRQEREDAAVLREKLKTAGGRAELGLAEDDVLVDGGGGAAEVEDVARLVRLRRSAEEEERRDAELARSLADTEEEEMRRKRRRREREDELIAREMQERFERDVERELKARGPVGRRQSKKSKRSSPFDNGRGGQSEDAKARPVSSAIDSSARAAKKPRQEGAQLAAASTASATAASATAAGVAAGSPDPDDSSIQSDDEALSDNDESKMPATIITAGKGKSNEEANGLIDDTLDNDQSKSFAPGEAEIHVLDSCSDDDDDDDDRAQEEECSERTLSSPLPAASAAASAASSCSSSSRCKPPAESSRCISYSHEVSTRSASTLQKTELITSEFEQSAEQGVNRPPQYAPPPPPLEKPSKKRSAPSSSSPSASFSSTSSSRLHQSASNQNRPLSNGAKETRGKINEEKLSELIAMGFPEEEARQSYVDSKGDMEVAVAMLLSGAD